MTEHITIAVSRRAECGEGPVWDAAANAVHWVDILAGEILTTDLERGTTVAMTYPATVGAAAPRTQGGWVAAVASGFVAIESDGQVSHRVDILPPGIRMNDAKTDPRGRFWAGSCATDFAPGFGGLWRLDEEWRATLVLPNLTQPNGMGWSPAGDVFYLVETQAKQILSFPFDADTGALGPSSTVLVDAVEFTGYPDGLTVDAAGNLWVAEFAGSAVHEFSPDGRRLRSVAIPTTQPTSCAFVGSALDELWVTSAAFQTDPVADPAAGSVFQVSGLGTAGMASERFRG
ncbi:hypothetical protein ASE14_15970 [Agromyces sp. Root81]|uniref:SMP-30/gluconolactonase/LRE family protein n=1 Tax=Agromyces sp. Root81 TaxID=1736601 RepID=UPI0006F6B2D0|nr:SMP-30/gluconolactonase/LRE family protein [Agromyces sp. Root81]KRC59258.1 hypothetical protein ASE14_15970 [Agromyces sp. Root81]